MDGLDKIIDEIISEAKDEAQKVIDGAKNEISRIDSRAKESAAEIEERGRSESELAYRRIAARAESKRGVTVNRAVLAAKQELISSVLDAAKNEILELDTAEYFSYMERLLEKYAVGGGEIIFSPHDLARVTAGFRSAAEKCGVTVSNETRDIDGGFILVNGDIEENCSIDALMSAERDALHDEVGNVLF